MTRVQDVWQFIRQIAPDEMAMEWDTNGLSYGNTAWEVRTVLVSLDLTLPVVQEAERLGAELIVTHHPLLFTPVRQLNDTTPEGSLVLALAQSKIAALNAHTSLDCAPGGVNDCLAQAIGLQGTEILDVRGRDAQGNAYGLGRIGEVPPCPLPEFAREVKTRLNAPGVRFADGGKTVRRVAVGGGACGDAVEKVKALGCDTFVTADLKYHQFLLAHALGVNLIDAGHFSTENVVCPYLAARLQEEFPDLRVKISETHKTPEQFV